MLYTARFRVVTLGEIHFFDRPTSAVQWLDREDEALKAAKSQRNDPASKLIVVLSRGWGEGIPFFSPLLLLDHRYGPYFFFSFGLIANSSLMDKAVAGEHWNYLH